MMAVSLKVNLLVYSGSPKNVMASVDTRIETQALKK